MKMKKSWNSILKSANFSRYFSELILNINSRDMLKNKYFLPTLVILMSLCTCKSKETPPCTKKDGPCMNMNADYPTKLWGRKLTLVDTCHNIKGIVRRSDVNNDMYYLKDYPYYLEVSDESSWEQLKIKKLDNHPEKLYPFRPILNDLCEGSEFCFSGNVYFISSVPYECNCSDKMAIVYAFFF